MIKTSKAVLVAGAILAGLAVGIGAFGAHGLQDLLREHGRQATFETGVKFQFYHSLALLLVGILMHLRQDRAGAMVWAARLILAGTLIFSFSLYILCLTNVGWWGAITPIGGTSLLIGWGLLAWGIHKSSF
ncbi:MAG: DUF423 domain-containing protein [Bernardetiaceae bacterium]